MTICTTRTFAQQNTYRNIAITALADRELLENDAGKTEREIKNIIAFFANIFKNEFGVTLKLRAVKPWQFPYGKTKLNAHNALSDAKLQTRDNKN